MEGQGQIYQAIIDIMEDMPPISKDRTAQGAQAYKFRGIDDIIIVLKPLLVKHKVFVVPKIVGEIKREERETSNGKAMYITIITMQFTYYTVDGSFIESVTVGEAMDLSDKSANKAMSAAFKYSLLDVFAIPTDEPKDTENDTHEVKGPSTKFLEEQEKKTINLDDFLAEAIPHIKTIAVITHLENWYRKNENVIASLKVSNETGYNSIISALKEQRQVINDVNKVSQ